MSNYVLQTRKLTTLGADMAQSATSATLVTSAFGTPTGKQIITIDGDVSAKAADFECTIIGTAVTSMTLLNGPDVAHATGALVDMRFVDEHYSALTDNGVLGYAEVSVNQAAFSALTDLTNLAVTVTVPAGGRRIRITGYTQQYSSVGTDSLTVYIREGATVLNSATMIGGYTNAVVEAIITPAAGSHTYKLSGQRVVGTGNFTQNNAATQLSFILVEYLGGV